MLVELIFGTEAAVPSAGEAFLCQPAVTGTAKAPDEGHVESVQE